MENKDNMTLQEELKKVATSFNVAEKDVEQKYNKLYIEELNDGRTPLQAQEKALRRTYLAYRRENLGKAVRLSSLVLGVGAPYDNAAEMRELALQKFKENPAKALAEGYVNEQGQPLDNDPFLGDGKTKNFNFKKPLPEHDYSMKVFGLMAMVDDAGKPATPILQTTMWCRGDSVTHPPLPMHGYDTTGIVKNQGSNSMTVNSAKATVFRAQPNQPDRTALYMIMKSSDATKGLFHQAEHLADWIIRTKDVKIIKSTTLMIEGDVLICDPEVGEGANSWQLVLDDGTENGLRCFMPKHVPCDCAEDDRIVVVGNVRPATEKYAASINGMGILLHPDYLPPVEAPKLPTRQETLDITRKYPSVNIMPAASQDPKSQNASIMTNTVPAPSGTSVQNAAPPAPSTSAPTVGTTDLGSVLFKVRVILSGAKEIQYIDLIKSAAQAGVTADLVEKSVRTMLMQGECYEPKVGLLKWVEISQAQQY